MENHSRRKFLKRSVLLQSQIGLKTFTGGRLKRVKNLITDNNFMFTYGDGVSDVNLKKLLTFHEKNKKLITITAVRPPARFGEIIIKKEKE